MFCKVCGNEVKDGAKFCNVCGTPVAGAAPQQAPQIQPQQVQPQQAPQQQYSQPYAQQQYAAPKPPRQENGVKKLIIIFSVIIGLIIFLGVAAIIFFKVVPNKSDNTKNTSSSKTSKSSKKKKDDDDDDDDEDDDDNDDDDEKLIDVNSINVFENIDVVFSGNNGSGTVTITNNNSDAPISEWTFEADKTEGLSNGDTITVSLDLSDDDKDECIDELGVIPEEYEAEYTVEGLSDYISTVNDLSTGLSTLKTKAENIYQDYVDDTYSTAETFDGMRYVGAYVMTPNAGVDDGFNNAAILVYAINTSVVKTVGNSQYSGTYGYYWAITFYDLKYNESGTFEYDENNYQILGSRLEYGTGLFENGSEQKYYYDNGYDSLSAFEADIVTYNSSNYTFDSNVDTSVKPVEFSYEINENTTNMGVIFTNSSTTYLTDADVMFLTKDELQTAINEIYARNGYQFSDQNIYNFFCQYDWYHPVTTSQEDVKRRFNDYELKNVELLQKYRDR